MSKRKYHSVIDAVINLTRDIQLTNANNNIIFYLLLNIKETFDHVSLQQLVNVMKKLKMFKTIIK